MRHFCAESTRPCRLCQWAVLGLSHGAPIIVPVLCEGRRAWTASVCVRAGSSPVRRRHRGSWVLVSLFVATDIFSAFSNLWELFQTCGIFFKLVGAFSNLWEGSFSHFTVHPSHSSNGAPPVGLLSPRSFRRYADRSMACKSRRSTESATPFRLGPAPHAFPRG
jgi:hypothetical protein